MIPLCWCPNACASNHRGTLTRWKHLNLRLGCRTSQSRHETVRLSTSCETSMQPCCAESHSHQGPFWCSIPPGRLFVVGGGEMKGIYFLSLIVLAALASVFVNPPVVESLPRSVASRAATS